MRRILLGLAGVVLATWATNATAQVSVRGSSHDLSNVTGADVKGAAGQAQEQVCVYCHMPHNAINVGAPLWNRSIPAGPFAMYSQANSATFQLNAGDINTAARPVGPVSLACLSCHDGVTAFNSLNQTPMTDEDMGIMASTYTFTDVGTGLPVANMTDVAAPGPGSVNLTTDLTNDHPISFTYDTALATLKNAAGANGGLSDPATALTTNGGGSLVILRAGGVVANTIQNQMLFTNPAGIVNQLECASCHEPHMQGSPGSGAAAETNGTGAFPFLIKGNYNSNLCFTCHNK